jgi:hypothetical protein
LANLTFIKLPKCQISASFFPPTIPYLALTELN